MRLSYVQIDSHGVHDPASEGPPTFETRRTHFVSSESYGVDLADGIVTITHRQTGRQTITHFAQCRYAVVGATPEQESYDRLVARRDAL